MNHSISKEQITSYQENGFLIVDDFLSKEELGNWRKTIFSAVENRNGIKIPGTMVKTGDDDKINYDANNTNSDADFFGKVFDQIINLWQTDDKVKKLILDEKIAKMVAELSGSDGMRPWHDQALFKLPWANPTAWHLDTPFWSFSNRNALSIWIALDDSTLENGCLYFLPGSHKKTSFENFGIGKNMDVIFNHYPQFRNVQPVAAPIKAGSCTFHNGLCIHGAGPNMTAGYRRAMTCAFMPDGSTFNGQQNILSEEYFNSLKIGEQLNNEKQNPLIYSKG